MVNTSLRKKSLFLDNIYILYAFCKVATVFAHGLRKLINKFFIGNPGLFWNYYRKYYAFLLLYIYIGNSDFLTIYVYMFFSSNRNRVPWPPQSCHGHRRCLGLRPWPRQMQGPCPMPRWPPVLRQRPSRSLGPCSSTRWAPGPRPR